MSETSEDPGFRGLGEFSLFFWPSVPGLESATISEEQVDSLRPFREHMSFTHFAICSSNKIESHLSKLINYVPTSRLRHSENC